MTVEGLQRVVRATLPSIIAVNWEPEGGKNQLDATVLNVLTRMSKDKDKSKSQGAPRFRSAVKLKMAAVAAERKEMVEMSSASSSADEPPLQARPQAVASPEAMAQVRAAKASRADAGHAQAQV